MKGLKVFLIFLVLFMVPVGCLLWLNRQHAEAMFEARTADTVFLRDELAAVIGDAPLTVFRVNRDDNCFYASVPISSETNRRLKAALKSSGNGQFIYVDGVRQKWTLVFTEIPGEIVIGAIFGRTNPKPLLDEFPRRVDDRRPSR